MNARCQRGSVTIFQIIILATILLVFTMLSSALIKKKTENNLMRAEMLVSESLLNTYNSDLYSGFSLLGYESNKEINDNLKGFYEEKYNVKIKVTPIKLLSDENMIVQMKKIVVARLGVSYLDDLTVKLEIKDDIVSNITRARELVDSAEKNLESYDELLALTSSFADVLVDIKNGHTIESLDDDYGLHSINRKINKIIKLDRRIKHNSDELMSGSGTYIFNKIKSDSLNIVSSNDDDMIGIIEDIGQVLSLAKKNPDEIYKLDESLFDISKRFVLSSNGDSNGDDISNIYSTSTEYIDLYRNIKDMHKKDSQTSTKKNDLENERVQSSNLLLNPIDKLALIEYMTIMLSDQVLSEKRDHYYSNRTDILGYENAELEYVITSCEAPASKSKIKNFIRGIRFPLNLIHIYSSTSKRESINALALTISTILPIPPFISSPIIASAWSLIETEIDIKIIYGGGGILVFKMTDDDWSSDFGIIKTLSKARYSSENLDNNSSYKSKNQKLDLSKKTDINNDKNDSNAIETNKFQELYYNDYLRLMALTKSSSDMMNRFKKIVHSYIDESDFNINTLIIEHRIDIFLDEKENYRFKESLLDGYIK